MRLGNKRAFGSIITTLSSLFVEKDAVTPSQDFLLPEDSFANEHSGDPAPSLKSEQYGSDESHEDHRSYQPSSYHLHEGYSAISMLRNLGLLPSGVPNWMSALMTAVTPETFLLIAILHILVLFYVERIGK